MGHSFENCCIGSWVQYPPIVSLSLPQSPRLPIEPSIFLHPADHGWYSGLPDAPAKYG